MKDEYMIMHALSSPEPGISPVLQPGPAAQLVPLLVREHPRGHG